jgi:methionine-rich copper-binding protein CopC
MPSRRLAVVVTVVLVLALAVVAVAPAFASPPGTLLTHTRLAGSTPADGSTTGTAAQVTLVFTEDVNPDFVEVEVTGPGGAEAAADEPQVDGRTVTQELVEGLPEGGHTVAYRVVSADGHPVAGTFTFTTTAAVSASPTRSATATTPPTGSASPSIADSGATTAAPAPDAGGTARGTGPAVALLAAVALGLLALWWGLARHRRGARNEAGEWRRSTTTGPVDPGREGPTEGPSA